MSSLEAASLQVTTGLWHNDNINKKLHLPIEYKITTLKQAIAFLHTSKA
jgi:hypothetical protein